MYCTINLSLWPAQLQLVEKMCPVWTNYLDPLLLWPGACFRVHLHWTNIWGPSLNYSLFYYCDCLVMFPSMYNCACTTTAICNLHNCSSGRLGVVWEQCESRPTRGETSVLQHSTMQTKNQTECKFILSCLHSVCIYGCKVLLLQLDLALSVIPVPAGASLSFINMMGFIWMTKEGK